jgi:hypothetical protein
MIEGTNHYNVFKQKLEKIALLGFFLEKYNVISLEKRRLSILKMLGDVKTLQGKS